MYKYIYPLIKWKIKPWLKHYIVEKSGKLLPDEYQQVDYIESSGTQYINTGYIPNSNTIYDLNVIVNSIGTTSYIIGAQNSTNRNNIYISSSGNISVGYGTEFRNDGTIIELNTKYNLMLDKNLFYVNNNILYTFTQQSFTNSINCILFARNNNGTIGNMISAKLYNCKIYDNDTLVRDFIPCYRKSDNVVGLYDVVNNIFYTNAGTGAFGKGSDV